MKRLYVLGFLASLCGLGLWAYFKKDSSSSGKISADAGTGHANTTGTPLPSNVIYGATPPGQPDYSGMSGEQYQAVGGSESDGSLF